MIEVAGAVRARRGEQRCGDAWLHLDRDGESFIALVDALGHGPEAAAVADVALRFLEEEIERASGRRDLEFLMAGLDGALRGSRGVVAALLRLDVARFQLDYLAVGNIEAHVRGSSPVRLLSSYGMLGGGRRPRLRTQTFQLPTPTLIVLHTDGLAGAPVDKISPTASCDSIAALLLEHWARTNDDAGVVVARLRNAA